MHRAWHAVCFPLPSHNRDSLPWVGLHDAGSEIPAPMPGMATSHNAHTSEHRKQYSLICDATMKPLLQGMCWVQVGESVLARVTLMSSSGTRLKFKTECLGPKTNVLIDGAAVALMPS